MSLNSYLGLLGRTNSKSLYAIFLGDITHLKTSFPVLQEDPQKIVEVLCSMFSVYSPIYKDVSKLAPARNSVSG